MGHAIGLLAIEEGTDNAKGSASTLEGSYLAPSEWRDRSAIDASEGRVALASAREARVREMKGSRPNSGLREGNRGAPRSWRTVGTIRRMPGVRTRDV